MKYLVRLSEARYGEVEVDAESEEQALDIASRKGKAIDWFDSEITDMTAEVAFDAMFEDAEGYIQSRLSKPEILCQLAEEAAELAQAALKLRRALDGTNPTPVSKDAAAEALLEEFADVTLCGRLLLSKEQTDEMKAIRKRKQARWVARLKAAGEGRHEVDADAALKFLRQYAIKDSKEVYTNGSELVPLFRIEQALVDEAYKGFKEG